MIVCVEGPSAVGKTTTSAAIAARLAGRVIPEVDLHSVRPDTTDESCYLQRQADRWAEVQDISDAGHLAVLDGDPFQPLWYNWSFSFRGLQTLDTLRGFYRPMLVQRLMRFPELYVQLVADRWQLRQRKDADSTRDRHNFDKHLRLVDTMPRYFAAMSALDDALVCTVDAARPGHVVQIIHRIEAQVDHSVDAVAVFDALTSWLADDDNRVS